MRTTRDEPSDLLWLSTALSALAMVVAIVSVVLPRPSR